MAKRRRRKATSSTPRRAHTTRRRRRRSTMSEPGRKTRRRRSGGRRRRGLSEIFSPAGFRDGAMNTLWGTGGGMAANLIDRLGAGEASPLLRGGIQVGAAVLVSAVFKQDKLAAGMAGGYGYTLLDELLGERALSEDWDDTDYADDDAMSEYPDALDEEGNPMFLAEDGNLYYLEEFDLAEDGTMYLAENGMARMYPDFVQEP